MQAADADEQIRDLIRGLTAMKAARRARKTDAADFAEQVNAAFRKHIDPKKLVVVEAGDFKKSTGSEK